MNVEAFEHELSTMAQADCVAHAVRLFKALAGVASCATQCGCCEMHVRVAKQAMAWKLSNFCLAGPLTEADGLTPERRAQLDRQCVECEE